MIRNKFIKNVMMFALTAALVATPAVVNASTTGSGTGGNGGNGGNGGGDGGTTVTAPPSVASSSSITLADGKKLVTTVPGQYAASNVAGVAVTTPLADVNAALAVGNGEKAQVRVFKSACGKLAQETLNNAAASIGVPVGPTLDILAGKIANGKFSNIDTAAAPVQFSVGVPSSFKEAGMDYAVIRVQNGGVVTVLPDMDSDPNTVTFNTNAFGVFAITKAPAGSFNAFK